MFAKLQNILQSMLPKQKQTDAQKVAYFRQGQYCTPLVQHTCKENVQTQCGTQSFLSTSVRVEFTSPQPGWGLFHKIFRF